MSKDTPLQFTDAYGNALMGVLRYLFFFFMVVTVIPAQLIWRIIGNHDPLRMQRAFYGRLLRFSGFKIFVHGTISQKKPTLFVSNHISYLDIPILGTITPGSFVAKAEVRAWPAIGYIAHILHTVFIERRSTQIGKQRTELQKYLENGRSLILFPEGTSSDGLRVLPFKSSLFSIVEDVPEGVSMTVQPVSIACTGVGGLPLPRAWRPHYAWYGDMTLVGHLWNVFKIGDFRIDVIFHPPLEAKDFSSRKTLATTCQEAVARGIEASLKGRDTLLLGGIEMHKVGRKLKAS